MDRKPNPHVGFGIDEHFGANLARLELRVIFRALAERLEEVELAGPYERMRSSFLGGVKRMPIRYRPPLLSGRDSRPGLSPCTRAGARG